MKLRDKMKPKTPFQFHKVSKKIVYCGKEIDLYSSRTFRAVIRKSYYQVVTAEKNGKLPRPMFVEHSTGRRYYTVWELLAASEIIRKNGVPNFNGRTSKFGDELSKKWAEIRRLVNAGKEPAQPIFLSFPSREALEDELFGLLAGYVESRGGIKKIAERIIEKHINNRGGL